MTATAFQRETKSTALGLAPLVDPSAELTACTLGRYTSVGARTRLGETTVSDYSYIENDATAMYAAIGKFCSIAAQVRLNPGNHPMQRASQSHFTYRASSYFTGEADGASFFAWRRSFPVTIGHDVWIGHGAIVLPGVTVGTGAVVGVAAVVTKDVAPYQIVAGVPARPIRPRFEPSIAERLMRLAWWDWDHDRLHAALADFRDLPVAAFLDRYGA
jgi:phosphonate metabolism protein (transferase hexapeptide repeat family)